MRDITLEDTIYPKFTTRAFATGIPTTLSGTPVISAYEDDNLTEITSGVTLGVDHDSRTGTNMITVVATAANGFENGKEYQLIITTGTVGGVSVVGEVVSEFTIGSSSAAVDLSNGTDGLGAIKTDTAATLIDTNELQTDDVPGLISTLNDLSSSEVLTQVDAALDTVISELAVAAPTSTPTLRTGLMLLYMALRNKTVVQTSGTDALEIYNDAGTIIASKLLTDDGSDYTEAEMS